MHRRPFVLAVLCLLAALSIPPLAAHALAGSKKVIVLGFDGVDAGLFEKYLEEGKLPNLQKLKERGTYLPLATTNPAQSPVAWASLTTGSWPGKTNVYDFIEVQRPAKLPPYPNLAMAHPELQRTLDNENIRRLLGSRAMALGIGALALALLLKIFRVRWLYAIAVPAVLLGLATTVGYVFVSRYLPEWIPQAVNTRKGTTVWEVVGKAGLRATVVEAPLTFPPDKVEGAKILAGLGVPDIAKTWGFWSFFTSEPDADESSETGGWIYPLKPRGNVAEVFLHGPEDLYAKDCAATLIDKSRNSKTRTEQIPHDRALVDLLARTIDSTEELIQSCDVTESLKNKEINGPGGLEEKRRKIQSMPTGDAMRDVNFDYPQVYVKMRLETDPSKRTLTATVQGRETVVELGKWSDWINIDYKLNPLLVVKGISKIYFQKLEPHLEVVMTPIQFNPGEVPPIVDLTHPHDYAEELCEDVGLFETVGWATMTNPLKDERLDDDGFIQQAGIVFDSIEKLSIAALEKRDWDFYFTMFAVTDRVQHMMYRMIDPKSPTHDPAKAAKYGDEIQKIYQEMDRFVGEVADEYLDEDTLLMVVSDHGFKSFRRGVNINRWLANEGYLVGENLAKPQSVGQLTAHSAGFDNVTWEKTKAYSLGLGNIYINVKGREGQGIVEPGEEYDQVCDEIAAKLRTLKDTDGTPVVKEVYKKKDLYHGPYLERAADLVVGFNEGYRVSWQTTLGGAPADVIEDNKQTWSGDHCSVDPSLVPGILVSNRRLPVDSASVVDIAPTVCAFLGIAPDSQWDGRSLLGEKVAAVKPK